MAEILTGVTAVTAEVIIGKVAEVVAPAATVTEAGTAATLALELDKVTTAPPGGAGALKATVFAEVTLPPTIAAGERLTAETPSGFTLSTAVFEVR